MLGTLAEDSLLDRRGADGDLNNTFETNDLFRDESIEEVERFDMILLFQLPQLFKTVIGSLLQMDGFHQIAFLEHSETISVVAQS